MEFKPKQIVSHKTKNLFGRIIRKSKIRIGSYDVDFGDGYTTVVSEDFLISAKSFTGKNNLK